MCKKGLLSIDRVLLFDSQFSGKNTLLYREYPVVGFQLMTYVHVTNIIET